jgi:ribonuclease E
MQIVPSIAPSAHAEPAVAVAPQPVIAAVAPPSRPLPPVEAAPMSVEALTPLLEQAGLILVQTAPAKHAEALARIAAEPRPIRVPRERPALPPLDVGPLIQVETLRRDVQPSQST